MNWGEVVVSTVVTIIDCFSYLFMEEDMISIA